MKLTIEGDINEIEDFLLDLMFIEPDSVPLPAHADPSREDRTYQKLEEKLIEKKKGESVPCGGTGGERDIPKPVVSVPMAPVIKERDHDRKTESLKPPAKEDLLIPRFEYNKKLEKPYNKLFIAELPDGGVVLSYFSAIVYTTKERVLQLPYPTPKGFLKTLGAPNKISAVLQYRKYLTEHSVPPGSGDQGPQQDIKDPDEAFKPKLKGAIFTHPGREDFEKIEGSLEA